MKKKKVSQVKFTSEEIGALVGMIEVIENDRPLLNRLYEKMTGCSFKLLDQKLREYAEQNGL